MKPAGDVQIINTIVSSVMLKRVVEAMILTMSPTGGRKELARAQNVDQEAAQTMVTVIRVRVVVEGGRVISGDEVAVVVRQAVMRQPELRLRRRLPLRRVWRMLSDSKRKLSGMTARCWSRASIFTPMKKIFTSSSHWLVLGKFETFASSGTNEVANLKGKYLSFP